MPEQDAGARELQHPEEVLDVILPAGDEPPRVVEPGKEALDLPAPATPTERASILGPGATTIGLVGRDHLDAVALAEQRVERITVVAAVADQSRGEVAEETRIEGRGDEVRLIR